MRTSRPTGASPMRGPRRRCSSPVPIGTTTTASRRAQDSGTRFDRRTWRPNAAASRRPRTRGTPATTAAWITRHPSISSDRGKAARARSASRTKDPRARPSPSRRRSSSIKPANYTFLPSVARPFMPTGQNWTILKRGHLVDWFGRNLANYSSALWDNADLIRITGSYAYSTFTGASRTIFMEPFDWTDVSRNQRFWGQSTNVTAVAWCSTGSFFVTGGTDATNTMWDAATGYPIRQFGTATGTGIGDVPYVNDIDVSPDCSKVAVATGNVNTLGAGRVAVFNANTGAFLWRRAGDGVFGYPISSVRFSPDNTRVAYTPYINPILRMLFGLPATDAATFPDVVVRDSVSAAIRSRGAGHKDVVNRVAWSADSSKVITGAGDTNWLWDNSVLVFSVGTNPAGLVAAFSGHLDSNSAGVPFD